MSRELIETIEIGSGGAASIEFTSIPQDAKQILLLTSLRADNNPETDSWTLANLTINGDGLNLLQMGLAGLGSGDGAFRSSSYELSICSSGATSNTFSNNSVLFANYTDSLTKQIMGFDVTENNATSVRTIFRFGYRTSSAAITSLKLQPASSGNFVQYSTASLYKIS